ncbi:hypothetical protein LTR37_017488 [Vermiconidia calcicola]|uniref:Uncharacterized protein n=1 Tax=Vermiconidia calcicola TaxID=1690605 RepID=A0ACC3MJP3_9PEZI|nr:hypothetical protein LTR37_017488 [Vermiconidia calcicola]
MSLRPNERSTRDRSRSRTRDRSRSRSNVRATEAPRAPSPPPSQPYGYTTRASPDAYENGASSATYDARSPTSAGAERSNYFGPSSAAAAPYPSATSVPYPEERSEFAMPEMPAMPWDQDDGLAYGDVPSPSGSRQPSYSNPYPSEQPQHPYPAMPPGTRTTSGYTYTQEPVTSKSRSTSYTYEYAQPSQDITYTTKPQTGTRNVQYTDTAYGQYPEQLPRNYPRDPPYDRNADVVEITPRHDGSDRKASKPSKSIRLSVDTPGAGGLDAPRSPGMTARMDRLSVSGNRPDVAGLSGSGVLPPPSPMLEAYHGTYQQLSPGERTLDDELDNLPSLSPEVPRSSATKSGDRSAREAVREKEKRRVKLYDPEADAKTLSKALGAHKVDVGAICDVLPTKTHDEVYYLKKEYKKLVKVQGKGVNLSKHLKTKLAGNFGKAAYVTALGRWESEGYWANFWYQSHSSRRELLIESLMGRTNGEIWNIKGEFKDKRYSDDLVQCMEKELKMDKFRTAVLMVLEERRQEELDIYPVEYRDRDVDTLYKALKAKQGGESVMLEIVVRRSDAHLREVLKMYKRKYSESFPDEVFKKSNNLVGEVMVHILNGVINKPARDSLLLHHAIKDIAERKVEDKLRYELLISRLVRIHWDKAHLQKVKDYYWNNYKKNLENDIDDAAGEGDFADFMWELCSTTKR